MDIPSLTKLAVATTAAAGFLSACGGSGMQPALATSSLSAGFSPSWMTPEAKKKKPLLYVTDQFANAVYAFTYPGGKLVGTLTGFFEPVGVCADKKGDIFVINFVSYGNSILEYKHGGTSPIATLQDNGYYPKGCSVDPTTEDLAVTSEVTSSGGQGNVAIYPHGSGSPKFYSDSSIFDYYWCAYDTSGNLYIDGTYNPSTTAFAFAELPKGASGLTDVTLNVPPTVPGGVAWDGKHVTVGDYSADANVVYRYTISGSAGTEVGSTPLTGAYQVEQYALWPKSPARLIAPNAGKSNTSNLLYYKYPQGGSPTKTVSGFGGQFTRAAAISK